MMIWVEMCVLSLIYINVAACRFCAVCCVIISCFFLLYYNYPTTFFNILFMFVFLCFMFVLYFVYPAFCVVLPIVSLFSI